MQSHPARPLLLLLLSLCLAAWTRTHASTLPASASPHRRHPTNTPSSTGHSHSQFYTYWTDSASQATYTNLSNGSYHLAWTSPSHSGNLVGGKGRETGTPRPIGFSASFRPHGSTGLSLLSIYGWTHDELVEYYIVEDYGAVRPGEGLEWKGKVWVDAGWYDVYLGRRTNAPSIEGTRTFRQFWSVRRRTRSRGTVNVARHFAAWKEKGMVLGSRFGYQVVAVEGYRSAGDATVTVHC